LVGQTCTANALLRARQHRGGSIDADDAGAGFEDGHRNAAGAASELQHRAVLRGGEPLPRRATVCAFSQS
jgi:hypothetical protein